jgi:tellurite resistance protein TerC
MNLTSHLSAVPESLWIIFSIGILILLLIDLSLFGKHSKGMSAKVALLESGMWICVALAFNWWFSTQYGPGLGMEFLTSYLVEKSLSVDNIFVILLIFTAFKIPAQHQHKILFYGVLGAIVFRAFFILLGAQLLHQFHWLLYVFGGILVVTALKFLIQSDKQSDVLDSFGVRLIRKIVPTTKNFDGGNFFTVEGGIRKATPLLLALMVIEFTDIVFAVDSVPAVFAVTQDAFVAFASNILAILGLRALYFVLADWIVSIRYLKPGLSAILGFIGMKMLLIDIYKIPSNVSLLVIVSILATAALSSWYVARIHTKAALKGEKI